MQALSAPAFLAISQPGRPLTGLQTPLGSLYPHQPSIHPGWSLKAMPTPEPPHQVQMSGLLCLSNAQPERGGNL